MIRHWRWFVFCKYVHMPSKVERLQINALNFSELQFLFLQPELIGVLSGAPVLYPAKKCGLNRELNPQYLGM